MFNFLFYRITIVKIASQLLLPNTKEELSRSGTYTLRNKSNIALRRKIIVRICMDETLPIKTWLLFQFSQLCFNSTFSRRKCLQILWVQLILLGNVPDGEIDVAEGLLQAFVRRSFGANE